VKLAELPVYVIHAPRLRERRIALEASLAENGVSATWVEDPDADELDPQLVRLYYRPSRVRWWRRARTTQPIPYRRLTPREIAVTIAHVRTLERIGRSAEAWSLVLEDDAILVPAFSAHFDEAVAELPEDADAVYIGSCSGLRVADAYPGRRFYRVPHPATKCSDSTLIRRDAAAAAAKALRPFVLTIDWELNYHFARQDAVVYWLEPPLVSQGSETGVYTSSQR
jgi:GR25 family glycosyltransferase involved in LPS biosynthesis